MPVGVLGDDGGVSSRPDPSTPSDRDDGPGPDAAPAAAPDDSSPSPSEPESPPRSQAPSPPRRRIGPRPMRKPERGETSIRDMLGALLLLIPVGLLIVTVGGSCSFAPTGPTEDARSGPTVDVAARLTEYARGSAFGLRVPDVAFRANSTDRGPVEGGGTAVRTGYITPDADYLALVQTDATTEGILATESGAAGRGDGPPAARGTVQAAGLTWEVYQAEGGEPYRVATLPGTPQVRLLITGSADDAAFATLAEATVNARVLPAGGAPAG